VLAKSVTVSIAVGVVLRQAWSKSHWTVLMGILLPQQMLDAIKHITDDNFFFQEDCAQVHCVCNTIQLSEICDFHVSAFCQVVQKHKLFEVA